MSGGKPNRRKAYTAYARDDGGITLPADSPVLEMFKNLSIELTNRQDRHERIVKLSRDITIESKRIIFQLHSSIGKENEACSVKEASERLQKLIQGPIRLIGLELQFSPAYLHNRAASPGFQEFIEARTLCHLIQHKQLIPWQDVQNELVYTINVREGETKTVTTMLPQLDYMLGLSDLTGELMRRTINCITTGERSESQFICSAIQELYTGFLCIYHPPRELARKLSVSRANTMKAESAMFAVQIRGDKTSPELLAHAIATQNIHITPIHDDDEDDFYANY